MGGIQHHTCIFLNSATKFVVYRQNTISIAQELVRDADRGPISDLLIKMSGVGSRNLHFNKFSR